MNSISNHLNSKTTISVFTLMLIIILLTTGCAPDSADYSCEQTLQPHTSSIPSKWIYPNANVDYGSTTGPSTPLMANNGKLFLLSGWGRTGKITAFDAVTGIELWSRKTTEDLVFASSSIVLVSD